MCKGSGVERGALGGERRGAEENKKLIQWVKHYPEQSKGTGGESILPPAACRPPSTWCRLPPAVHLVPPAVHLVPPAARRPPLLDPRRSSVDPRRSSVAAGDLSNSCASLRMPDDRRLPELPL